MGSHEARQAPPTMTGGSHSHHQSFYSLDSLEIICFFYFSKQKKLVHGSYYMDIIFRINFVNPYLLFCLTVHLNWSYTKAIFFLHILMHCLELNKLYSGLLSGQIIAPVAKSKMTFCFFPKKIFSSRTKVWLVNYPVLFIHIKKLLKSSIAATATGKADADDPGGVVVFVAAARSGTEGAAASCCIGMRISRWSGGPHLIDPFRLFGLFSVSPFSRVGSPLRPMVGPSRAQRWVGRENVGRIGAQPGLCSCWARLTETQSHFQPNSFGPSGFYSLK